MVVVQDPQGVTFAVINPTGPEPDRTADSAAVDESKALQRNSGVLTARTERHPPNERNG